MANPVGQTPWAMTPEILKKAEYYASLGLTKQQIASCLGMGERTLYEKINLYPQFSQAIKNGIDKGIKRYANRLVKHSKKGNVAATIFFLKARAKWSDNPDLHKLQDDMDELKKLIMQRKTKENNAAPEGECRKENNEEQVG